MTRTEKLAPAYRIAELKKRDAAKIAENSKQKVLEYERKLQELIDFRKDYSLSSHFSGSVLSASQLVEHQKFMRQLDEGIRIIEKQLEGHKQDSEIDRRVWLDAYQRSDAMDKLIGKLKKMEQGARDNRLENEIDERSQSRRVESK